MNQHTKDLRRVNIRLKLAGQFIESDGYTKHDHLMLRRDKNNDRLFFIVHYQSGLPMHPYPYKLNDLLPLYDMLCNMDIPWELDPVLLKPYVRKYCVYTLISAHIRGITCKQ